MMATQEMASPPPPPTATNQQPKDETIEDGEGTDQQEQSLPFVTPEGSFVDATGKRIPFDPATMLTIKPARTNNKGFTLAAINMWDGGRFLVCFDYPEDAGEPGMLPFGIEESTKYTTCNVSIKLTDEQFEFLNRVQEYLRNHILENQEQHLGELDEPYDMRKVKDYFTDFVQPRRRSKKTGKMGDPLLVVKLPLQDGDIEPDTVIMRKGTRTESMCFADMLDEEGNARKFVPFRRAIVELGFFWYGAKQFGVSPRFHQIELIPKPTLGGKVGFNNLVAARPGPAARLSAVPRPAPAEPAAAAAAADAADVEMDLGMAPPELDEDDKKELLEADVVLPLKKRKAPATGAGEGEEDGELPPAPKKRKKTANKKKKEKKEEEPQRPFEI